MFFVFFMFQNMCSKGCSNCSNLNAFSRLAHRNNFWTLPSVQKICFMCSNEFNECSIQNANFFYKNCVPSVQIRCSKIKVFYFKCSKTNISVQFKATLSISVLSVLIYQCSKCSSGTHVPGVQTYRLPDACCLRCEKFIHLQ